MRKIKNKRGFTLIELVMSMGISMIILMTISGLFVSILSMRADSQKSSTIDQAGNYLFSRLTYDIQRAQDILEPAVLGQTSDELQIIVEGQVFTFRVIDVKLYMVDSSDSYLLSGDGVKVIDWTVRRLGNLDGKNAIELNLTLESEVESDGKSKIREYQTTVSLR